MTLRTVCCNTIPEYVEVRNSFVCTNRSCSYYKKYVNVIEVQEQMAVRPGFSECPEDRPNLNDISKSSFAPPMIFGPDGNDPRKHPSVVFSPGSKDEEVIANGGTQFSTGAVRSSDKAGVMYHLITPIGLRRIAETYKEGFDKYGAFNWERGMPIGDILNHAIAHIYTYLSGEETGEDDLAHAAWNLLAAMHIEETHPTLDHQLRTNHPLYQKMIKADEEQSVNTPNNQATT